MFILPSLAPVNRARGLLEWKGIEATVELARGQNAKLVVVGNPKTGLPMIFSGER